MATRRRRRSKLKIARKGGMTASLRKRRQSYVKHRAKRLRYAKTYYRKNKAKILAKRKRYYKRTKGVPLYKSGKPGGRWPRAKRFKYSRRTRRGGRRRAA